MAGCSHKNTMALQGPSSSAFDENLSNSSHSGISEEIPHTCHLNPGTSYKKRWSCLSFRRVLRIPTYFHTAQIPDEMNVEPEMLQKSFIVVQEASSSIKTQRTIFLDFCI